MHSVHRYGEKTKKLFISKHMHLSPVCFMSVSLSLSLPCSVYVVLAPCTVNRGIFQSKLHIEYRYRKIPKRKKEREEQHQHTKLYFKVPATETVLFFTFVLDVVLLLLEMFRNLQLTTGNKCLGLNLRAYFRPYK